MEEIQLAEALKASRETDLDSYINAALTASRRLVQPIDLRQVARAVKPTSALYSAEDFTRAQEAVEDALTDQYKSSQGNKPLIGHRLGLQTLLAAYCFGSETRRIELDEDRYLIGLQYSQVKECEEQTNERRGEGVY